MKKYSIYILVAAMSLFSSCEKFFHTEPHNFLHPESYYTDKEAVEAGLMGVYQIMVSPFAYSYTTAATIYSGIALPILFTTSDLEYFSETSQTYYASMFKYGYVLTIWVCEIGNLTASIYKLGKVTGVGAKTAIKHYLLPFIAMGAMSIVNILIKDLVPIARMIIFLAGYVLILNIVRSKARVHLNSSK